jgi:hypothetical protein
VGFEPTIPVFKREKTVHALNLATTVIGRTRYNRNKLIFLEQSPTTEDGNREYLRNVGHSRSPEKISLGTDAVKASNNV